MPDDQSSLWYWMTSPLQSGRVLSAYALGGETAALEAAVGPAPAPIESGKQIAANLTAGILGTTPNVVRTATEETFYKIGEAEANVGQTGVNVVEGLKKASEQFRENPTDIADFLKKYSYAVLGGAVLIGLLWAYRSR